VNRGEVMEDFLRPMLNSFARSQNWYCVEGVDLSAKVMHQVAERHEGRVFSACLVFEDDLDIEQKLHKIRVTANQERPHFEKLSDDEIRGYLMKHKEMGILNKIEANKYEIPVFQCAADYTQAVEEVVEYFEGCI